MKPILYAIITSRRDEGCFGVLLDGDKKEFAVFLMRTFDDNRIVVGPNDYTCNADFYHKGGYETFEIILEGHDRVLFHKLNWESQSEGCMGIGESFEIISGKYAIAQSGKGFEEFMKKYKGFKSFTLKIREFNWETMGPE